MENRLIYFSGGSPASPEGADAEPQQPELIDEFKNLVTKLKAGEGKEIVDAHIADAEDGIGGVAKRADEVILDAAKLAFAEDYDGIPGENKELDALNAQCDSVLGPLNGHFELADDGVTLELVRNAPTTEKERITQNFKSAINRAKEAMDSGNMVEAAIAIGEVIGAFLEFKAGLFGKTLNNAYESADVAEKKDMSDRHTRLLGKIGSTADEDGDGDKDIDDLKLSKDEKVEEYDDKPAGNPKSISAAKTAVTTAKATVTTEETALATLKSGVTDPMTAAEKTQIQGKVGLIASKKQLVVDAEKKVTDLTKEKAELQKDIDMIKGMKEEGENARKRFESALTEVGNVFSGSKNQDIENLGIQIKGTTNVLTSGSGFDIRPATVSGDTFHTEINDLPEEVKGAGVVNVIDATGHVSDPSKFMRFLAKVNAYAIKIAADETT